MKRLIRLVIAPVLALVATAALAAAITGIISTGASAAEADWVPCDSNDYVKVTLHQSDEPSYDMCFANAGDFELNPPAGSKFWVTTIWTGNNRVQWYGDGRWQPDNGINKWTEFSWPNHPGGVDFSRIRIL